jgi:hypothetical protein
MLAGVGDDMAAALARGFPIEVAIAWARRRVGVVPVFGIDEDGLCQCGNANCPHAGKHPVPAFAPHGARSATTDIGYLLEIYKDRPDMNVAVAPGRGLVCLDIDPRHGGDVAADYGLPRTFRELSGGDDRGAHDFFRTPVRHRQATTAVGPGATMLGDGGLVVVAPSRHVSGRHYRPVDPAAPLAWLPPAFRVAVAAKRQGETVAIDPTLADPVATRRVLAAAVAAPYGDKLRRALRTGTDPGFLDATNSGVAWNAARLLCRHTADDNTIAAILLGSALPRPKGDSRRWLALLIHSARTWTRPSRGETTASPVLQVSSSTPQHVIYPTLFLAVDTSQGLGAAVLTVVKRMAETAVDGFVPIPVGDIAVGLGAHPDSVGRALDRLARSGAIETRVDRLRTRTGRVEAVRWAKVVEVCEEVTDEGADAHQDDEEEAA